MCPPFHHLFNLLASFKQSQQQTYSSFSTLKNSSNPTYNNNHTLKNKQQSNYNLPSNLNKQQFMLSAEPQEQREPCNRQYLHTQPHPTLQPQPTPKYSLANFAMSLLICSLVVYICVLRQRQQTTAQQLQSASIESEEYFNRLMQLKNNQNGSKPTKNHISLPKILWLYSQFKLQGQKMLQQFIGNNTIKVAKQWGWQVRITNSWQAYDWISAQVTQKITSTMQNMRISQKVNELIKIALLMEHGGVMVSVSEVLLAHNPIDWLSAYLKQQPSSQVLLFTESSDGSPQIYQDYFIAAVPNADLIVKIFEALCDTITLRSVKYPALKKASYVDTGMNVTVVSDILKNTINGILNVLKPELFSVATIHLDVTQRLSSSCEKRLFWLMRQSKQVFSEACGKNDYFLRIYQRSQLQYEMEEALDAVDDSAKSVPTDSYWHQLLDLNTNLKYFLPAQPREVRYCVLDANSNQNLTLIQQSFESLEKQSYKKWNAVYFADEVTAEMKQYADQRNKLQQKITLVKSSSSLGRNYELGIIKHCPSKSFIVLLKSEDSFSSPSALQLLSATLQQHGVLGAFISMNVSGQIMKPKDVYPSYTKQDMNGASPSYSDLNNILNYLKVFHSDCYKILPQFSHYTHEGQYYNDRFKFLQAFIRMVVNATKKHDISQIPHTQRTKWFIKSSYDIFDVPNRIEIVQDVVININQWEQVNRTEIAMNSFKQDVFPMTYNLDHLLQNGQSMTDFAIYNQAEEIEPYTIRNKPDIIPKVFHLIWIQGEMPQPKRKVLELNQKMYPDFKFKIWSKANITRQNFPLSYDLLLNIYACNKFTRYSKMATMADVMRHQMLYYQGGIYMDTSMLIFRPTIYKWLSYKVFLSSEHILRHRWSQSMCIFAVAPRYPGLLRIIHHSNTNRYNIFLRDALEIAGPNDFRHLIQGDQEYDKDILILDFDGFYPQAYANGRSSTFCLTEPYFLKHQQEFIYRYQNMVLVKDCAKHYPYSFGKELNALGTSWQNARWWW